MNRHGISQNPTTEEAALLRKLWAGDNARNRANLARKKADDVESENARLRAENEGLRVALDRLDR